MIGSLQVVTLRKPETEAAYKLSRETGDLSPLYSEEHIREFQYWRIVNNRFPYDKIYQTHHLLIPKRKFALESDMWLRERDELTRLKQTLPYDQVLENTMHNRSICDLYHLHLGDLYTRL